MVEFGAFREISQENFLLLKLLLNMFLLQLLSIFGRIVCKIVLFKAEIWLWLMLLTVLMFYWQNFII